MEKSIESNIGTQPYTAPQLMTYGSVEQLTQGGFKKLPWCPPVKSKGSCLPILKY